MQDLNRRLRDLEHSTDHGRFREAARLIEHTSNLQTQKRVHLKGRVVGVTFFPGHRRWDGSWKDEPDVTFYVDVGERYLVTIVRVGPLAYQKADLGDGESIEFSAIPDSSHGGGTGEQRMNVHYVVPSSHWHFLRRTQNYDEYVGRYTVHLDKVRINRKKLKLTPEYQFRKVVEEIQDLQPEVARW